MRYGFSAVVAGLALAVAACGARSQVHEGVVVDHGGLDHIEMAIGDVYGMPVGPLPSYIYPDELPVVYLLAREAGVSPEVVMALREQGWSWLDITYHLGVDPYVYVAHLPRQRGYWGYPGRNYAYLTDRHIIDYVNLALWASYHRRPVTQLIIIRQRVPSWVYYVHFHAPRVVFVHNVPRRHDRGPRRWHSGRRDEPRRAEPRRAEPRDATPRQGSRTTAQQPTRTIERRPPAPVHGIEQPGPRSVERSAIPSRPTEASRPVTQPTRPATQQSRMVPQPTRPVTQPTRPATQQSRMVPQPTRPVTPPTRPATQQSRMVPQPTRPVAQPMRPATQQSRPAAQPSRPATQRPSARPSRPAAQPSRPAGHPSRPAASRPSSSGSRGESASSSRSSSSSSQSDSRGSRRGG